MSGIAEVLINLGYDVSGSDLVESATTRRLSELGAQVARGHDAGNVEAADVVVASTAVAQDNAEIMTNVHRRLAIVLYWTPKRAECASPGSPDGPREAPRWQIFERSIQRTVLRRATCE